MEKWRLEHPHDMPPYRFTPSPTFGQSTADKTESSQSQAARSRNFTIDAQSCQPTIAFWKIWRRAHLINAFTMQLVSFYDAIIALLHLSVECAYHATGPRKTIGKKRGKRLRA